MNVSKQKQDEVGEFRIELQEKLGEWLENNFPHGVNARFKAGVTADGNSLMPVSSNKSSRARALHDMPAEEFEKIIEEIKADENTVVTPNAILEKHKQKNLALIMTLYDFIKLDEMQQTETIWSAVQIAQREDDEHFIKLLLHFF